MQEFNTNPPGSAVLTSEREIRRVTWWGFSGNIVLSVFKIVAGIAGHSQSVVADGIHSLSDTVTDVAVIAGSYYWSRPPDQDHPYGHKRLETTVSIFIGVILFAAGALIGWEAVSSLDEPDNDIPGIIAPIAAAISIVTKEWMYRWTRAVGKRINSLALSANAWHHRLDAFSSVPVLVAVGVIMVRPTWVLLDHLAAFFVAILICYAAIRIILSGFKELNDQGAPLEVCEQIRDIVLTHPSVRQVHDIRTRYTGNSLQVDLHVVVDSSMTVYEGHQVAENIKARVIADGPDVIDVVVHVEPMESAKPGVACR